MAGNVDDFYRPARFDLLERRKSGVQVGLVRYAISWHVNKSNATS